MFKLYQDLDFLVPSLVSFQLNHLQQAVKPFPEKQVDPIPEPEPDPVVVNKDSLIALITSANEKLSQTEVEYTEDSKDKLNTLCIGDSCLKTI